MSDILRRRSIRLKSAIEEGAVVKEFSKKDLLIQKPLELNKFQIVSNRVARKLGHDLEENSSRCCSCSHHLRYVQKYSRLSFTSK